MGDMTTISTCGKCGLHYRESLIPHECADWTKGRKEVEETQPMSDTLSEQLTTAKKLGFCEECLGYDHAPWCSSYESDKEVSNQTATATHQPAARGGGDEGELRSLTVGQLLDRSVWATDSDERVAARLEILNQHQSLVAEREARRAAMRRFVDAYADGKAARLGNGQARRSRDEFRQLLAVYDDQKRGAR